MRRLLFPFNSALLGVSVPTGIVLNLALMAPPALANCSDMIGRLEYFQPAMERLFQQLQDRTDYPWGTSRPYGTWNGDRITLTPEFDTLDGTQKRQVIQLLRLGYGENPALHDLLTPEEWERPGIGALSPYKVFGDDGRLIHTAYDGCTPVQMLTERDRFEYYYNALPWEPDTDQRARFEDLYNGGEPFWRTLNFPLAATEERSLRIRFWETVGYDKANQDWWIAWVPEHGYFEINVPTPYDAGVLDTFWQVAPEQYRYAVLASDGTPLEIPD